MQTDNVSALQGVSNVFWPTLAQYGFVNFWSTNI